jgi:competence protein ComEA
LEAAVSRTDRITIAAIGCSLLLAIAGALVLLAPFGAASMPEDDAAALLMPSFPAGPPDGSVAPPATIVVDVAGAVANPGIRELPAGARLADAIDAAGGFATDADLDSATALNLAQPLIDGQQVRVPRLGDAVAADGATASFGTGGTGAGGGLVDVNTATPEELEALPGIGAVTVQKIVAARQERPFSSLQDMVDRGIIHRGQLEDITGLASAG